MATAAIAEVVKRMLLVVAVIQVNYEFRLIQAGNPIVRSKSSF
jgi:hypothetical protein